MMIFREIMCIDLGFIKPKYVEQATLFKDYRDAVRLLEESLIVVCPNPKCRRQIKESILLTIYSVMPPKQYDACPYCFANLELEPQIGQNDAPEQSVEQNIAPEPTLEQEEAMETAEEDEETADYQSENIVLEKVKDSGPRFLKRFKALIPGSSGLKKEKKRQTEELEPEAELEDEPEPAVKEKVSNDKPKTEPSVKETEQKPAPSVSKEDLTSGCPATFGYLANRPKDEPIPQGCLVCPKMVDCMLSPRED